MSVLGLSAPISGIIFVIYGSGKVADGSVMMTG